AETLLALAVGVENGAIHLGCVPGHPREERWAEVEADAGVVVDNPRDAAARVQNACRRAWSVALSGDALVPVVIGIGRLLQFNGFQPRVFPWRLVEVPVNADVPFHGLGDSETTCMPGLTHRPGRTSQVQDAAEGNAEPRRPVAQLVPQF